MVLLEEFSSLSIGIVLICVLVVVVAGLVHGTLGLGFPLVATPMLSVVLDVRLAIGLTLLPVVAVNVASIVTSGVGFDRIRPYLPLALAAIAGTIVGSMALVWLNPDPFRLILAALIVLWLSSERLFGSRLSSLERYPLTAMLGFGFIAGIAAGSTNVMVAVLIIYVIEMRLPRAHTVAVLNFCFLSGKLTQIGTLSFAGVLSMPLIVVNVGLTLIAISALLLGVRLSGRIAVDTYRVLLRLLLLLLAFVLVVQYFLV